MKLSERQEQLCSTSRWDFSDLRTLFLNCTLKKSPERSHTEGLFDIARAIMERNGVTVAVVRPVDFNLAFGVWPDMTEHGWSEDGRHSRARLFDLARREDLGAKDSAGAAAAPCPASAAALAGATARDKQVDRARWKAGQCLWFFTVATYR